MNKEEEKWEIEEFQAFYYFYIFRLFFKSKTNKDSLRKEYFRLAVKIFSEKYNELMIMCELNSYEKISAITSLYKILIYNCDENGNKEHSIGEYKILLASNPKLEC